MAKQSTRKRPFGVIAIIVLQWPLFLVALALMALPSLMATWPGRKARPQTTGPKAPLMREPVE